MCYSLVSRLWLFMVSLLHGSVFWEWKQAHQLFDQISQRNFWKRNQEHLVSKYQPLCNGLELNFVAPLTLHPQRLLCSPIQPHSLPVPLSQPLPSSMTIYRHHWQWPNIIDNSGPSLSPVTLLVPLNWDFTTSATAVSSDIINTITSKDPLVHYLNRYCIHRIHFFTIKIIASAHSPLWFALADHCYSWSRQYHLLLLPPLPSSWLQSLPLIPIYSLNATMIMASRAPPLLFYYNHSHSITSLPISYICFYFFILMLWN